MGNFDKLPWKFTFFQALTTAIPMVFWFDSHLAHFRFFFFTFFQAEVLCLGVSVRLGLS